MTEKEKAFLSERLAFALVDGDLLWADGKYKLMPMKEWLLATNVIDDDEFQHIIRGTVYCGYVHYYSGDNYDPADISTVPADLREYIISVARNTIPDDMPEEGVLVANGCIIGEPGILWDSIEYIGTY